VDSESRRIIGRANFQREGKGNGSSICVNPCPSVVKKFRMIYPGMVRRTGAIYRIAVEDASLLRVTADGERPPTLVFRPGWIV
jgi:hypothetical protein